MDRNHILGIFFSLQRGCKWNRSTAYFIRYITGRLSTEHNWNIINKLAGSLDAGNHIMFDITEYFYLKLEVTNQTVC